jgi:UDP-N-acetylglucosamine:LPS N-acetylglucosamine transferase
MKKINAKRLVPARFRRNKPPVFVEPTPQERVAAAEQEVNSALLGFQAAATRVRQAKTDLEKVVEHEIARLAAIEANKREAQNKIGKFQKLIDKLEEFAL